MNNNHWWPVVERVIKEKQAKEYQGILLDLTSANVLKQVADNLSEKNKEKLFSYSLPLAVNVGWTVIERAKARRQ